MNPWSSSHSGQDPESRPGLKFGQKYWDSSPASLANSSGEGVGQRLNHKSHYVGPPGFTAEVRLGSQSRQSREHWHAWAASHHGATWSKQRTCSLSWWAVPSFTPMDVNHCPALLLNAWVLWAPSVNLRAAYETPCSPDNNWMRQGLLLVMVQIVRHRGEAIYPESEVSRQWGVICPRQSECLILTMSHSKYLINASWCYFHPWNSTFMTKIIYQLAICGHYMQLTWGPFQQYIFPNNNIYTQG